MQREHLLDYFFKIRSSTHELLEEMVRHDMAGGSQEYPNCEAFKEAIEHILFECTSFGSQR